MEVVLFPVCLNSWRLLDGTVTLSGARYAPFTARPPNVVQPVIGHPMGEVFAFTSRLIRYSLCKTSDRGSTLRLPNSDWITWQVIVSNTSVFPREHSCIIRPAKSFGIPLDVRMFCLTPCSICNGGIPNDNCKAPAGPKRPRGGSSSSTIWSRCVVVEKVDASCLEARLPLYHRERHIHFAGSCPCPGL